MKLVRGAWKILVGIKDALVLIFMLLFFTALFAALSARPNAGAVKDGALVLSLDGTLVEQASDPDPWSGIGGGSDTPKQFALRDVVRALDSAKTDSRVKAVVLDLDRFMGGYPAAVSELGNAIHRVTASGKPVLAYATAYTDSGYLLAANASEVWVHPMGGTLFMGPGGTHLYYKGLLDKLGVNAHVYRVGAYKSAVEPYIRSDMSPEARQNYQALYGSIFSQWQEQIARARPKARLADFLTKPDQVVTGAHGDIAQANLSYGLVDNTGDRLAFGKRVAEIVGTRGDTGFFKGIKLADYLEANPAPKNGQIGVVTVAGEIVDGKAGPGTAAGDTVSSLVLKGLRKHQLKALVVRVDSPGGSAMASEEIRQAILQAKAQGLPVVVSMGGLAASGGYWVSSVGDVIFAEPNTITGSIGIFGIIPTFEKTLAKIGVTSDGVATTPITGQPDVTRGTNPAVDTILQSAIENGYARFVSLVSQSRHMSPQRVNDIGGGRVWIGGTAHQLGLVDRFGTLDDAVAEAARRAGLDPAKARPVYLDKEPNGWLKFISAMTRDDKDDDDWVNGNDNTDVFARIAIERRATLAQALGDARRLATGGSVQARCLECMGFVPTAPSREDMSLLQLVMARFGA